MRDEDTKTEMSQVGVLGGLGSPEETILPLANAIVELEHDLAPAQSADSVPSDLAASQDASGEQKSEAKDKKSKKSKKSKGKKKGGKDDDDEEEKDEVAGEKVKVVPLHRLFRFADKWDYVLMVVGSIAAAGEGIGMPLMTIFFGDLINALLFYTVGGANAEQAMTDAIHSGVVKLCGLGAGVLVGSYLQMSLWMLAGERQARRIREAYFAAVMRQEVGWFDRVSTGSLTTRMTGDTTLVQDGISEKVGSIMQNLATFIGGFAVAFSKGPKLAGVLCSALPALALCGMFMARVVSERAEQGQDAYAKAGALAEAVFSSIRTVAAFGGEEKEIARYGVRLEEAKKSGYKRSLGLAIGFGLFMFVIYSTYALGYWYGSLLVEWGELNPGQVMTTFFAVLIGAFALGNIAPEIAAIATAKGAAAKMWHTIDRVSRVDSSSNDGVMLEKVEGRVEFHEVSFSYPSRPDVPILKDFSLVVEPCTTVALVGSSGSGKSTIVKLLERFYDPTANHVSIDGTDIATINVRSLRSKIGIVSQEPVLFNCSIRQNILYGIQDELDKLTDDEMEQRVVQACKDANVYNFIMNLPHGLDTEVGQGGGQLSGGQKQRIAIARAIISRPSILILDEATSALDSHSERLVQAALDQASQGRTTITIAHRLSTIRNAHKIVVMNRGTIVEMGTHAELIARGGLYKELVDAQALKTEDDSGAQTPQKDAASPEAHGPAQTAEKPPTKDDLAQEELLEAQEAAANAKDTLGLSASAGQVSPDSSANAAGKKPAIKSLGQNLMDKERREKARRKQHLDKALDYGELWRRIWIEKRSFLGGSAFSVVTGCIMPIFAIFFGHIIAVLSSTDMAYLRYWANFWSGMFFMLAGVSLIATIGSIFLFGVGGENMVMRMRQELFRQLIYMEIAYFDLPEHNVGIVCHNLSDDTIEVRNITSTLLYQMVQMAANFIAAMVISLAYDWQLALVCIATVPAQILASYMQFKALAGFNKKTKEAYEQTAKIANEAIETIRTVVPLNMEAFFHREYVKGNVRPHGIALRGAFVSSIGFALGQGMLFFVYALAFWYAGERLKQGASVANLMVAMFSIIFMSMSIGRIASFSPNISKARIACIAVFETLNTPSAIDASKDDGKDADAVHGENPKSRGQAEVVHGQFRYPTRADVPVFQDMCVVARPGQTIALVGPSGCGKSTVIQALERFYDMHDGAVLVEGEDVRQWQLRSMRRQLALVGQEPVLFDMSIANNICYGVAPEEATQERIEAVARMANIHDFVVSLPKGYQTSVGERGGQLSGGQKQRVAIARALMRQPHLLLLDEATSALDSESEGVVQDALDKAAVGRTTIVIAHRLSTIQNADCIYVIRAGAVVEQGKHFELLAMKGMYHELVMQQTLAPMAKVTSSGGPSQFDNVAT